MIGFLKTWHVFRKPVFIPGEILTPITPFPKSIIFQGKRGSHAFPFFRRQVSYHQLSAVSTTLPRFGMPAGPAP